jgi:hypothetical protein
MTEQPSGKEPALDAVDSKKRETLRRMAKMAFAAPVVASFAMDGLTIESALAGNSTVTAS